MYTVSFFTGLSDVSQFHQSPSLKRDPGSRIPDFRFRIAILFLLLFQFTFFSPSFLFSQGSWNPPDADLSFPRTLLDTTQVEEIRSTLSENGIYPLYELVWDHANSSVPAGNGTDSERFTRSTIAKEAAFVMLMDRKPSNGSVIPLTTEEREQLKTKSRQVLEAMNTAVGFQSGWMFYQEWQHRSKELINYLIAYDLLRGQGLAVGNLQLARDSLIEFTAHLYHRAMATYTVMIWQLKFFEFQFNNHSIMTASALGLAAIVLNDQESSDPDYQPQNWIDAGLWNLDNTLWRENGLFPRVSEPDSLAGYAEGPAYFEYGFENAFPFIRAFWNFLPDSTYAMTFNSVTRNIRNPWYDPDYANLYEWMNRIRLPDGSSPAIHDSPVGFGTSITALSGNSRFNISNPHFPPSDVMWRTQYISTNVAEGSFSDTLFRALPEAGSLVFRSSQDPGAVYMHFIGKHGIPLSGAKAHHQGDAGSFSLMANGELLAVDPGYPGYQESSAVNNASNHSLILVNGYGPLPPVGEMVSIETNTCWIGSCFDTPAIDYGEIQTTCFGADIIRKNLFIRNHYFILTDFINSETANSYTFQLQGNGLAGGTPGTPEGAFTSDFANHQGIWSRDSTQLLVHTIATNGATDYSVATDSLATGTSTYRYYSKMLVRKDNVMNDMFLTILFPFREEQPDVVTLQTPAETTAITIEEDAYQDLVFAQQGSSLVEIPASTSGLQETISGNGKLNVASLENNETRSLFLGSGDSLIVGDQIYIKADHRIDAAYHLESILLHQGYVSDSGWVGFYTFIPQFYIPTYGNIIEYYPDPINSLLMVRFASESNFVIEFGEGIDDQPLLQKDNNIVIRNLGDGRYEVSFVSEESFEGILTVYQASGKNLLTKAISGIPGTNRYQLDLSGISSGLYIVSITTPFRQNTIKLIHP